MTNILKMVIEIVSFPIKSGGSFHSDIKLPEGVYIYMCVCVFVNVKILPW